MADLQRCAWAYGDPLNKKYHDDEWGRPVHDDQLLFEMLVLEGMQAGLSWATVLRKRAAYRIALDNFEIDMILQYDEEKLAQLMQNPGIIRNRLKIESVLINARAFRAVQQECGSFDAYLWRFVNGKPIDDLHSRTEDVPVRTELSDHISKDLKKRGFKFVGTTIVCSYMHAVGLMNGHAADCFARPLCHAD